MYEHEAIIPGRGYLVEALKVSGTIGAVNEVTWEDVAVVNSLAHVDIKIPG